MKKFFVLVLVVILLTTVFSVATFAVNENGYVTFSWATSNEGVLPEEFEGKTQGNRGELGESLGENDSIGLTGLEEKFTMEKIYMVGIEDFMQAFNISKFKCTNW